MMVKKLLMKILMIKTAQSISAKMYYVLFTKILQERDTARDCFSQKVFQNFCLYSQINTVTKSF